MRCLKSIIGSSTILLAGLLLLGTGCRSSQPVQQNDADVDASRVDVIRSAASHLRSLAADGLDHRETATPGEALLSGYIAGHFSRFDLQPTVAGSHERTYPLRKHVLGESQLWIMGSDTTRFIHGRDFTVHPRSSTGRMDVRILPGGSVLSGALGAVNLDTTAAAAGIFNPGDGGIRLVLDKRVWPMFERHVTWTTTVSATVSATEEAVSGRLVDGLYAGADPVMRDSMLVILIRMDVLENGIDDANVAVAAFLEVARRMQLLRLQRTPIAQSMLFVAYSGSEEDCQGPQWLVRNMPWERGSITGILHMGAKPDCWDRIEPMTVVESSSEGVPEVRAVAIMEGALSWIQANSLRSHVH